MPVRYHNPVHGGYFADPFVLHTGAGYVAYGTGAMVDGRAFEVLVSPDLVHWRSVGGALAAPHEHLGTDLWAPEVVEHDGRWWMYYSAGVADTGHHLRVAVAEDPLGPFRDQGVDLTPDERFAIDAHPFRDEDGTWYLFYARDVLEGERVGTMLAVDVLEDMTRLAGRARTILTPSGDWQVYARGRSMYERVWDWHTLEGPFVLRRGGRYWCLYSGGSWQEPTYGVSWAVADHPTGPWTDPDPAATRLLATVAGRVVGPGHNSVTTGPGGHDVLVYHAWDPAGTARRMCIDPLRWTAEGPVTPGPTWRPAELPD